jgi:hypothetical protein
MGDERPKVSVSLVCPPAFDYGGDSGATAGQRWPRWVRDFEYYLNGSGIQCDDQKKDVFLYLAGADVRDICDALPTEERTYAQLRAALATHFTPQQNLDFEYYRFGQMRKNANESLDNFVVRLRAAAKLCSYTTTADAEIKKQVIMGCR